MEAKKGTRILPILVIFPLPMPPKANVPIQLVVEASFMMMNNNFDDAKSPSD